VSSVISPAGFCFDVTDHLLGVNELAAEDLDISAVIKYVACQYARVALAQRSGSTGLLVLKLCWRDPCSITG
jgi:hypothetical protein